MNQYVACSALQHFHTTHATLSLQTDKRNEIHAVNNQFIKIILI
jgi:hypothetical protein